MTDYSPSNPYTAQTLNEMSAGDALQKLYSETESMGPDVGSVITDLEATPSNTKSTILKIKTNSQSFKAPQGAEKHFTDIVGDAREAADNDDAETALELLNDVIIEHLNSTVTTFSLVKNDVENTRSISGRTIAEVGYVKTGYEHMLELAEHARDELQNA